MVLTMLHDGAGEETAKEIRKALHFQGNSKFFEKYLQMAAYNARAKQKDQMQKAPLILESANSFWRQSGYDFREEYLELLNQRFLAEVNEVDFQNNPSEAVQEINKWCSDKTKGVIEKAVSEQDIQPLQRMMILNAIYFKGRWESVFDAGSTKLEWFHHADGTVDKTQMMNQREDMLYYEGDGFKAIKKPYCGNVHMLILLPDEADGLAELEKTLTPKMLRRIDDHAKFELVKVKLPRFQFNDNCDLIPAMEKLGVVSAFDGTKANFSKMTEEKALFVNKFGQLAAIKVDEEGTVAAAVTATSGVGGGGAPPKPKVFYADRPFLFFICENTDNSILFMGRVHQPEKAKNEPVPNSSELDSQSASRD